MPAPLAPSNSTDTTKLPLATINGLKPKHKRPIRRRARARDELSDEEEVVREALSDSDASSISTDSDSGSDDGADHPRASTDDTTAASIKLISPPHSPSPVPKPDLGGKPRVIPPTTNWSEMVTAAEEGSPSREGGQLPVIDFDEFTSSYPPESSTAPNKAQHPPLPPAPRPTKALKPEPTPRAQPQPSDANMFADASRAPKPTQRQAYLDRLSTDPSYVPRVGAFWGHDERLMDKDLRSMSGWWRGRWQGRGGRPGWGPRGRGRGRGGGGGGFGVYPTNGSTTNENPDEHPEPAALPPPPLAPIEKSWTHDGFEEMKKQERVRLQDRSNIVRGGGPFQGNVVARGGARGFIRGGRGGGRGGAFVAGVPPHQIAATPNVPAAIPAPTSNKPIRVPKSSERPWTKQLDGFLHLPVGPKSKHRPITQQVQVKLPGSSSSTVVVRIPQDDLTMRRALSARTDRSHTAASIRSDAGSDMAAAAIVKLPKPRTSASKLPTTPPPKQVVREKEARVEVTKPPLTTTIPPPPPLDIIPTSGPPSQSIATPEDVPSLRNGEAPSSPSVAIGYDAEVESTSPWVVNVPLAQSTEKDSLRANNAPFFPQSVMATTSSSADDDVDPFVVQLPPHLERSAALAQVFTPQAQPPAFRAVPPRPMGFSPYPAPPTALPAGVAMGENGVFFEMATGRVVVLTPPPVAMYNPRPVLHTSFNPAQPHSYPHHPHPFTPDYANSPGTPPIHYLHHGHGLSIDSSRYSPYPLSEQSDGTPIFVPPRRTSRAVQIRAPGAPAPAPPASETYGVNDTSVTTTTDESSDDGNSHPKIARRQSVSSAARKPSNLRSTISADVEPFQPKRRASQPILSNTNASTSPDEAASTSPTDQTSNSYFSQPQQTTYTAYPAGPMYYPDPGYAAGYAVPPGSQYAYYVPTEPSYAYGVPSDAPRSEYDYSTMYYPQNGYALPPDPNGQAQPAMYY